MNDLIPQPHTGFQPTKLSHTLDFGKFLSIEIWIMIFEQLYEIASNISRLRGVSRKFNKILIPLTFRKVRLTPDLVLDRMPDKICSRVSEYIHLYTTYIVIDCKLDWNRVVTLLVGCRRLKDLELKYFEKMPTFTGSGPISRSYPRARIGLPRQIKRALIWNLPDLRVHCDFCHSNVDDRPYRLDLPLQNLVSLKLLPQVPGSYPAWTFEFARIMLQSPNLEVLHVRPGHKFRPRIMTSPSPRFYQIRELILEGNWHYTANDVAALWDFSRLSTLRLRHIDLDKFAFSVPFQQLSGLTKFEFLLGNKAYWADNLTGLISKVERLEELVLECYCPHKLIDVIEKHRLSLRVLKLKDSNHRDPSATSEDLEKLRTMCPYLNELELDIKVAGNSQEQKG